MVMYFGAQMKGWCLTSKPNRKSATAQQKDEFEREDASIGLKTNSALFVI